jgi:diguanylate cyclase (GGDEF)-like protein
MSRDIAERLSLCRSLPSLPAVAVQIIELAQSPDAELSQIARTIGLDPALATKLLRIANSPLYASKRRVDNLRQALTVLGLNATLSLALGFSLQQSLRQPCGPGIDLQSVWRRSILAATAARCLGEWVGLPRTEDLMLAGLVQDIGVLALGQLEPERYAAIRNQADDNTSLVALERAELGTDHAEVGALLATQWGLPAFLVEAIRQSESAAPAGEMNLCVALSGPIADIWIGADPEPARLAAARLCEQHLGMDRMNFAELTAEVSAAIPEISSLFDISLAEPQRITAILEHAGELMVIRNLKTLQDATRERHEAERLHTASRALQDRTRRDGLTGLANRAYLLDRLEAEFTAACANGWPLSLGVLDIDGFRELNTRDGRLAGDELLRNLAQLLSMNLRETDVVARLDDDTFCLLLPGSPRIAAQTLCRRSVEAVAATPLAEHEDRIIRVTVSLGLATLDGSCRFDTAAALLAAAEQAMHRARAAGGNQVAGFGSPAG